MNRIFALVILAFLLITVSAYPQTTVTETAPPPVEGQVLVKGILLYPKGSAAPEKPVFILESMKRGNVQFALKPSGEILNQGLTNVDGSFAVMVDRAFLESRQAVFCVLLPRGITPQYPNGAPLIVKPSKDKDVVDLGKVTITYD